MKETIALRLSRVLPKLQRDFQRGLHGARAAAAKEGARKAGRLAKPPRELFGCGVGSAQSRRMVEAPELAERSLHLYAACNAP